MQGILVVVSGFSGVGKGTLMKELLRRYPEAYSLSISATTREPRPGETHGVEYFFKTKSEFETMLSDNALLEHTVYNGNFYGTPKAYVESELRSGRNVILEIEVNGGGQIKKQYPESFLVFVVPPTASELKKRLIGRGTETEAVIENRMKRAVEEAEFISEYDYITVNDDFETCVNDIHRAILNQQAYIARAVEIENRLKNELTELMKGE